MTMRNFGKFTQYACAVLLISTSIALASFQVVTLSDVANGTLMYIAQAFLLAGSIFGLDYYVRKLANSMTQHNDENSSRDKE